MKKLLTIILFCILILGMASVASAADWRKIDAADRPGYSLDTQSFQQTNGSAYTVWLKFEYTSEAHGREFSDEQGIKEPAAYILIHLEFNYDTNNYRPLLETYYDKDGNVLSYLAVTRWIPIRPDTLGEFFFNTTYDYYKTHYK